MAKADAGNQEVQVRMPVGARAVRQQARDDPRHEVALAGQRADRGGDGAGGDADDLAEQAATIQAIGASRRVPCALPDRGAPNIRAAGTRTVTMVLRCRSF